MHRVYDFTGAFHPESFIAFVSHRARRLDIAVTLLGCSPTRITVGVRGQPDLLDAFEMACSLGPADALVHDVIVQSSTDDQKDD